MVGAVELRRTWGTRFRGWLLVGWGGVGVWTRWLGGGGLGQDDFAVLHDDHDGVLGEGVVGPGEGDLRAYGGGSGDCVSLLLGCSDLHSGLFGCRLLRRGQVEGKVGGLGCLGAVVDSDLDNGWGGFNHKDIREL